MGNVFHFNIDYESHSILNIVFNYERNMQIYS